ncbi:glycosyltransferase family 32 protein [Vibrio caribbeanicus]|uniref:glycosyltransferase family 32 protein n=1 Tax=Vibrio caribbeanicus TaxID=701175 RepID=UPI0022848E9B|nr:glycosyltransferase [Vibrio caribbeanicus]MCY9844266.1 glycosyltransferase [Vibrio caribbeanicus]
MKNLPIMIANRSIRLIGNLFKVLSYPFHFAFPKVRFTIPEYSPAKIRTNRKSAVTKIIWQTNFSNKSTLPVYLNYLFNRLMSLDYEYRYVSTEAREEYLKNSAPPEVYESYMKLTDGAAQADIWRLAVLHKEGGVYMDIDATLVWPLKRLLSDIESSLFIKIKKNTEYTNYFLATEPNNPVFKEALELIVDNVMNYAQDGRVKGVYDTTGPMVLNRVLKEHQVQSRDRNHVCIQGSFTNEYFQYMDKPRGKWTHLDPDDLIKK